MASTPRKPERMLTAEQEYDLWVGMLSGQISQADAAVVEQAVELAVLRCRLIPSTSDRCPK